MSNFDFGGGPGPGQTPPPLQLPPQPQQQTGPGGGGAAPPPAVQPAPNQSGQAGPGGGITPVAIVSLLVIVGLVLGLAWLGNRFLPIRSTIDSAWRGVDGNAAELTSYLRDEGFTCSDEQTDPDSHFHRLCAKFGENSKVSIEYAGPTSGEIMRLYVEPQGALAPEDTEALVRALQLSVPDQTAQAGAESALASGPNSTRNVTGAWGEAGWQDGVFTVRRTWTGPGAGTFIPGDLVGVRAEAEQQGYQCEDHPDMLRCDRVANGAAWTFTARASATPGLLSSITFTGRIQDRDQLDPAAELKLVLPDSKELDRMTWFVSTADQQSGLAGFARGVRMTYAVTPAEVLIDARTPCRVDAGVASC